MSIAPSRQEHFLPQLSEPISHYTHAVSFGNLLFVSGLVGATRHGQLAQDAVGQTRQIFQNLAEILESVGAAYRDVLKITVFLTNIDDREAIDPVRAEYFGDHRPASTLIEIARLARPGAKVEIETVVGIPGP